MGGGMTTLFHDISQALATHYDAQAYGVPVAYENQPWTPLVTPAEHHILTLAWEDALEAGFGGVRGLYEVDGVFIVGVKVPLETGPTAAMGRCQQIADAFQYTKVGGAEMLEAAIVRVGQQKPYYRYNVHLPFRAWDRALTNTSGTSAGIDPEAATVTINERFMTLVAQPNSVSVAYDNMPFELPGAHETWCSWSVKHAEGRRPAFHRAGYGRGRHPRPARGRHGVRIFAGWRRRRGVPRSHALWGSLFVSIT